MPDQEQKTDNIVAKVNFVWIGPFKESSFKGPITLANATNDVGQSYPITYWVEEERVAECVAAVSEYPNIQVKSITAAIRSYCGHDLEKEKRIYALLEKCKAENLPTIAKEILSPIIQSQSSGYFFDTSISAAKITNLPNLEQPALTRNLSTVRKSKSIDLAHQKFWHYDQYKQHSQYMAVKENDLRKGKSENPTSSDLYVYFSAASPTGEISTDSKMLFSRLAENTLNNWEVFFKETLVVKHAQGFAEYLDFALIRMINHTLLGAISHLYSPHENVDEETIVELDKKNNTLATYDVSTRKPRATKDACGFTTIDCIPGLNTFDNKIAQTTTPLQLFCMGKSIGITKYCSGSWKYDNFAAYIGRKYRQASSVAAETCPCTPGL